VWNYFASFPSLRHAVAHIVEAVRYKPEDRGVENRWDHWYSLWRSLYRSHYEPGVDSVSNRNEYHEYSLGVKEAGA
jgi:hypothetical protein